MPLDHATLRALANVPDALETHYALIPRNHRNWHPPSWEGIPDTGGLARSRSCATANERHYHGSHDQQHLAGLQWLPGQIAAARPPGVDS